MELTTLPKPRSSRPFSSPLDACGVSFSEQVPVTPSIKLPAAVCHFNHFNSTLAEKSCLVCFCIVCFLGHV